MTIIRILTLASLACSGVPALAQTPLSTLPGASHVIVPQTRSWAVTAGTMDIEVESVTARVRILEGAASTTLEVAVTNPGGREAEAVLLLPVPSGAAVGSFAFEGAAAEPTARLLGSDEARRTYDEIVSRLRDPALLEFAGYQLIRTSVFPVPPGGRQRVRLSYDHVLPRDGNRVDYVLPRSESISRRVPWSVRVEIADHHPISMVYSPSHDLEIERHSATSVVAQIAARSTEAPGAFRLSYLREQNGVSASLFAYPDPVSGGGYFLLMAALPVEPPARRIPREVTLVLDRSGSMAGGKFDQVSKAAVAVIGELGEGERWNVIDYATSVESFAPAPVLRVPGSPRQLEEYLARARTTGGTNIHDALVEALRQPPTPGTLPIVLFLTDGLPTVGKLSEVSIRELAERGNPHSRRIFTFGVGADVNAPLLDRLADASRGTATYVLPGEDVELAVARVSQKLHGPLFTDLELVTLDDGGEVSTQIVREVMPARLPDLFEGDSLVVLGRYRSEKSLHLVLSGSSPEGPKRYRLEFDLDQATTRNAFVPRLWASRRITLLTDQIRQLGAESAERPLESTTALMADPRTRELVEEIVSLSTEHGILTEYTSFLATEGTRLNDWKQLVQGCSMNLEKLAVNSRTGLPGVAQAANYNAKKDQLRLDYSNSFLDGKLERVEISAVQQVCDRAFLQQSGTWVDSRLVSGQLSFQPDIEIEFGSEEHRALVEDLVGEGRQGVLALDGDILLRRGERNVLIRSSRRVQEK